MPIFRENTSFMIRKMFFRVETNIDFASKLNSVLETREYILDFFIYDGKIMIHLPYSPSGWCQKENGSN